MDHESREVVLGLRVQEVVAEVDPVNCHPPAVEISHPPPGPPAIQFDTSSSFLTDEAFETREDLIKWVRDVAARLRFTVVIVNSDYGDGKRKQKLVLGCER
ncbi:protein FAR1-RELATED SEQUENCE 6-like, partial [Trifolium medium]|nr:protein FAR1-RELATED SEQUENCE 6-like [Trifolium medium]